MFHDSNSEVNSELPLQEISLNFTVSSRSSKHQKGLSNASDKEVGKEESNDLLQIA